jgi:hypothetical protein
MVVLLFLRLSCCAAGRPWDEEDVLEQVVDDYLQSLGFLTRGNVRYRPSAAHPDYVAQKDSGWGDIDVIGYSPTRYGADRVWVVSCKSWQVGLDPGGRLDQLHAGKEWHAHRELWVPKRGRPFVRGRPWHRPWPLLQPLQRFATAPGRD